MKKGLIFLFVFALLIGLWEVACALSPKLLFILPAPSNVFTTLTENYKRLLFHTFVTFKEMGGGFLLATCASFPLAWIMLQFKTSRALLQPLFIIIQCLPMFTLAPLMVIWFGWSYISIVIPTALMIFFPLTLNIYQGLRATPTEFLEFFEANQATATQTFFKLRLPWALPHIFGGFRIGSAIAGIGSIAGEWAGAQNGLGIVMLESRRNTDLELTFSALILLTLLSFSMYSLVILGEHFFLKERVKNELKGLLRSKKTKVILTLFLLTTVVGCQKREDKKEVRLLLDWLPNPDHVVLYTGLEKGFFQDEGIPLKILKMHECGGGIAYLTSEQTELIISHMPTAVRAVGRGGKLKIVGTLIKEPLSCIIFPKESNIEKLSDFTGKRFGYCLGGPDTMAFRDYLLKSCNIYPQEKMNVGVDLISALGTKRVDFIFGGYWNVEPFHLRSLGIDVDYYSVKEMGVPNYYELIILARADSDQSTKEFQERFKRALQKSIDFAKKYPQEAFEIYEKQNPDKRKKTLKWEKESWEATLPLLAEDQNLDPLCLEEFSSWLVEAGFFSKKIDAKSLIN